MIDREARGRMALLMRQLGSGLITNFQFEISLPPMRDPAIAEIFHYGVRQLYSPSTEERLCGDLALTKDGRRNYARAILFLKGELPYEWPSWTGARATLISIASVCTLGYAGAAAHVLWKRSGDYSVWPFRRKEDFERALKSPLYFKGRSPSSPEA